MDRSLYPPRTCSNSECKKLNPQPRTEFSKNRAKCKTCMAAAYLERNGNV